VLALVCFKIPFADEPRRRWTPPQIQILLPLRELQREFGMSVIFVTTTHVAIEIATVSPSCMPADREQGRLRYMCARRSPLRRGFWPDCPRR
jgi:hypothetical protein